MLCDFIALVAIKLCLLAAPLVIAVLALRYFGVI
jgi:hypothetical protein